MTRTFLSFQRAAENGLALRRTVPPFAAIAASRDLWSSPSADPPEQAAAIAESAPVGTFRTFRTYTHDFLAEGWRNLHSRALPWSAARIPGSASLHGATGPPEKDAG